MSRLSLAPALLFCSAACFSGCANLVETRAITAFTAALEQGDLAALKANSTPAFEEKALRLDGAVHDLEVLRLPSGEATVVSVEDVSKTRKNVTAEFGEAKTKLLYRLVRDEESGRWVVDDIDMKQTKKGLKVARSVTEQMDLLLSVREFLAAWSQGDRSDVMAVTTPEFGELLGELSPAYLARLTKQVVEEYDPGEKLRTEAQMDEDVAVVLLPRSTGKLSLSCRLVDGGWRVDDLAVESPSEAERIGSLKKRATALRGALQFLAAYEAEDRKALQRVCTERFYSGSLAPAELSAVTLPTANVPPDGYQLKMEDRRADFLLPTETEIVKVSLVRAEESEQAADTPVEYRVEEVTLYELDGTQEKRLSALFTSHAILELFAQSLAEGNLAMLQKTSTSDFNRQVWDQLTDGQPEAAAVGRRPSMSDLPLDLLNDGPPEIVKTAFHGALTEVTAVHGEQRVVYQLRDHAGEVRVDDILIDVPGRPKSLKETVGLLMPVRIFAFALHGGHLGLVQRTSSPDFNKLIWDQVASVPGVGHAAARHLFAPLTTIEQTPDSAMLTLGDERFGAKVLLVKDHSKFVVDEALLIAGAELSQRARLKQEMRRLMAEGSLGGRVPARDVMPMGVAAPSPNAQPASKADIRQTAATEAYDDPTGLQLLGVPEPSENAFTPPAQQPVQAFRRSIP